MGSSRWVFVYFMTAVLVLSVVAGVDDEYDGLVRMNLEPLAQLVHVRNEKRRRRRRLQVVSELDVEDYSDMEASFVDEILEMQEAMKRHNKDEVISGVYAASQLNLHPSMMFDDEEGQAFNETDGNLEHPRRFSKYEAEARWVEHMRMRQRRLLRASRRQEQRNLQLQSGQSPQLPPLGQVAGVKQPSQQLQSSSISASLVGQTDMYRSGSAVQQQPSLSSQGTSASERQITPLLQGYGTHYATAWVGTPPQRKSVIVDTGSHFTAFPCVGCVDCGEEHHTDKYFDPDLSSTFEVVGCDRCQAAWCHEERRRCEFSQSYTEGSSWHAYQVRDKFFLGGNDPRTAPGDMFDRRFSIPFMFGCQTSETGLFRTQLADGIMGMSAHEATLPKQLFNSGRLRRNMFSLCFRRELSVSKNGVTAGFMTLGGVDVRLNSSPMVYAANVHPRGGWYTVYVRNVYLLAGSASSSSSSGRGGFMASAEEDLEQSQIIGPDSPVTRVPMDPRRVNSGKGVIVDSGTTDTYLSDSLKKEFSEAWRVATGNKYNYHNNAMKLSREQVLALPTVLIQLQAFDSKGNPTDIDPDTVPGLTGTTLDKQHPHDVLLAIPPTHYLEYSPTKNTYTSRLYFTESTGGVLGANSMQGHDILFDWENGRVGFASSSCDHTELVDSRKNTVQDGILDGVADAAATVDCALSKPSISVMCHESVDRGSCGDDLEKRLTGEEKWVRIIETDSSSLGKSCQETAKDLLGGLPGASTECNNRGFCVESRPCTISCGALISSIAPKPQVVPPAPVVANAPTDQKTCGGNLFGACQSTCTQSRVVSVLMDDGECHATEQVESRPCHRGACGRENPCIVPFYVHVIIGFGSANVKSWRKTHEEAFSSSLSAVIRDRLGNTKVDIGAGDVNVLMASRWHKAEEATSDVDLSAQQEEPHNADLGMKLIAEISVFNTELANAVDLASLSGRKKQAATAEFCKKSDLDRYSQVAMLIHQVFQWSGFLQDVVERTRQETREANEFRAGVDQSVDTEGNTFLDVDVSQSKVLTSWTIKGDVGGSNVEAPIDEPFPGRYEPGALGTIVDSIISENATVPAILMGLVCIVLVLGVGVIVGYRIQQRDIRFLTEKERGRYTPIASRSGSRVGARRGTVLDTLFDDPPISDMEVGRKTDKARR